MAKSKNIIGDYAGKIGPVVITTWRGRLVIRSRPRKSNKPMTQPRLNQQAKLVITTKFLSSMRPFIERSFVKYSEEKTAFGAALSYNMKNAITGEELPFSIDYAYVLVSRGDLPNAPSPLAAAQPGSKIKFSWTDNSGSGKAKAGDMAMAVVYCPALKLSFYDLQSAQRSDQMQLLNAGMFAGEKVETWLAFLSVDGKTVSDSIYTGSIQLIG